jgi:hypothetical protein
MAKAKVAPPVDMGSMRREELEDRVVVVDGTEAQAIVVGIALKSAMVPQSGE